MELTFRAAAPAERLYIAKQSTQIEGQTGSVGHLQADMGEDGKGFFPKWTSHRESLDTEDFQQEFEDCLLYTSPDRGNRHPDADRWLPRSAGSHRRE